MGNPPPASPHLPLFYQGVEPLHAARHAGVGLKDSIGYGFAAATNAIPLVWEEFAIAQAHYPIVFGPPGQPEAYAAVGLRDRENLMVTADGGWLPGPYVPAYLRRYPFIFGVLPESTEFHLCVERSALAPVGIGTSRPLFIDGQPSPLVQEALRICAAYQRQYDETAAFVTALHERRLLTERHASTTVTTPGGQQPVVMGGLWTVDEAAFNALPDDVFLDWRRRGWVVLVHAHLLSMQQWAGLGRRLDARLA